MAGDILFHVQDFADEDLLKSMGIEDPFELTGLYESIVRGRGETRFLGYETTVADGRVVAILRDGVEYE